MLTIRFALTTARCLRCRSRAARVAHARCPQFACDDKGGEARLGPCANQDVIDAVRPSSRLRASVLIAGWNVVRRQLKKLKDLHEAKGLADDKFKVVQLNRGTVRLARGVC